MKILLLYSFLLGYVHSQSSSPWAWRCVEKGEQRCSKERKSGTEGQTSLETCKLTCGQYGSLFPYPKLATLGKSVTNFLPKNVELQALDSPPELIHLINDAIMIFRTNLYTYHPNYKQNEPVVNLFPDSPLLQKLVLRITTASKETQLKLTTDESYKLQVSTVDPETTAIISAPTFFGVRHALETLSQLIDYDEETDSLQIVNQADISDEPTFPYRGLIIDTARNYFPADSLKKMIDGMAYNKLNTFHWHLTESQSFPIEISTLPNMTTFGAYSPKEVYTNQQVKDIVEYARVRGIRVLPELDAPAHVGHGWQWGEEAGLGKLVVCLDKQPWNSFCAGPPCGQLNIANSEIYNVISKIYQEFISLFGDMDMFHFGGDEIKISCWNSSEEIKSWLTQNGKNLSEYTYYNEWGVFQDKAYNLFSQANGGAIPGIMWTSELTDPHNIEKYLDKNKYIIQTWTTGSNEVMTNLLNKGYRVIYSNYDKLYLDCGYASWVSTGNNWCSPYKGWQEIYDNDILGLATASSPANQNIQQQILGGEAAAWSEQIDEHSIDAKIWPRASAIAERLWSNPSTNYRKAEDRILEQRRRMTLRGINAERLQPEWCRQNSGECADRSAAAPV